MNTSLERTPLESQKMNIKDDIIYEDRSLVTILEEHLEQRKGKTKERDYFYASEIHNKCEWFLWHCLKGSERNDISANDKLTFEQGNEIHRTLMRAMLETREIDVITSEATTSSDLVHGKCDCIFSFRDGKEMNIVDFKSSKGSSWNYIPQDNHKTQVQVYQYFFDIDHGWLLYYNKETQELQDFYVSRDDEKVEKILERLQKVKDLVESGEKPDGGPNRDKWSYNLCKYCKFNGICDFAKVKKEEKGT